MRILLSIAVAASLAGCSGMLGGKEMGTSDFAPASASSRPASRTS
jgi:hypothetical protein